MKRTRKPAFAAIAATLGLAASPALAQPSPAPDYAKPSAWLCLPGRNDACSRPLPTTELTPRGYGAAVHAEVAKDPRVDCFYVYPTVSHDAGINSDLAVSEEVVAAQAQFARFASVCRTFAPIYRQMTVSAVASYAIGADLTQPAELAYSDVARAWRTYLAKYNEGRPFVLIGHSQGSLMLQQLIAREIEGRPVARRMLRAIIPGYDVLVPQGRRVGGTFKSTPLCSSGSDTGCVMTWSSYGDGTIPPEGAMFGWADRPGMTVGCTNPANPGSTGWEPLESDWFARSGVEPPAGPIQWSSTGAPPTSYLQTRGLVSARCVNDGQRGYLAVRVNQRPGDKWTDRVGGEVGMFGFFLPGWGEHLNDIAEAQGDLVREVGELESRAKALTGRVPPR